MTDKPTWPQTAGGVTDWEKAFEDPEGGLIPLISQARSASTLKQSALVIVEQLYIRENDEKKIKKFKDELSRMIPDDIPKETLPSIIDAVAQVLRQVKDERKKKAAEYEAEQKLAEINEQNKPIRRERRKSPPPSRLPLYIWGVALSIVMFAVYYYFADPNLTKETSKNIILIEQMKDAAKGEKIETHIFGGQIVTGVRIRRPYVTAIGITREACASAAWVLLNRGIIAINGKVPRRISPNIITDLCGRKGTRATLMWFPKQKKKKK